MFVFSLPAGFPTAPHDACLASPPRLHARITSISVHVGQRRSEQQQFAEEPLPAKPGQPRGEGEGEREMEVEEEEEEEEDEED